MVMIYALGRVSGGHLNPSISLAYALAGKMSVASGKAFVAADEDTGNGMLDVPRNFLVNGATTKEVMAKLSSYVLAQMAGGYAAGPISGAAFNPAVSLGID